MPGRVFTKLLLSFLLVLCAGTAILDFSVRRIVEHSLRRAAVDYYSAKAAALAGQLAAAPPSELPTVVRAQALAARADVEVATARDGTLAGQKVLPEGDPFFTSEQQVGALRARYRFSLRAVETVFPILRRDLLLASLLALALGTLMAVLLARRAERRLGRIVRFAHRIAAGELSARVEEGRLDEISEVAHALDATAARLEASFRALEDSRRELLVLLDSMQEPVIGVGPGGLVTWSNQRMRALSPVREGRPLVECLRDPEVLQAVATAQKNKALGRGRATGIAPGRAYAVSAAPMPTGGAVVVLYDVTDAERAERTRRDFVANVSHELRTPLTSITGYVETVLDEAPPGQTRDFLNIVLRNAKRMNRLTADLLALATVEAADYRLHLEPIAASELLDEILETLGGMPAETGIPLELDAAPATPVPADRDALEQVFGNLIENAMKYGRSGGRVAIGAREAGREVEFHVRDWGQGMAEEHLHRIFERFYRVDKARSRDSGGTGLGLAIVKHIVLAHGGRVWAESELGAGTTFFFTLPRAAAVPS